MVLCLECYFIDDVTLESLCMTGADSFQSVVLA